MKKCRSLKNSKLLIIKLNTSSIQYFLECQWLFSLPTYSPELYGNYGSIQSSWECDSTLFQSMNSQNPSPYGSIKSIPILFSHIHIGLPTGHFPLHSLMKNLFTITFTPMHATSLLILPLLLDTPVSDKQYKLSNYTFPLSLIQTLFWSLCSQTKPAYKWQKALHSNKTDHKPHFILHTNYVFQHQGAIIMEFITNKGSYVQHILQLPITLTFIIRIKY